MPHLPIPILRSVALGVAILVTGLIGARSASAEATLIVEADSGKVLHAEHAYLSVVSRVDHQADDDVPHAQGREGQASQHRLAAHRVANAVAQAPSKWASRPAPR
jgi:hypothetical protein